LFGYNTWNKDIDKKYQDYTRIMVIRNPWKRLLSHYIGQIQSNVNYQYRTDHVYIPNLEGISFDEFIELLLETPLDKLDMHYSLQTANLHESTKIDYIIHTEDMSIEIPKISKSLGLATTVIEKWGYPTNYTKDWKLYYNNISKNKVAKLYKKDIEVFGFKFD
jgi:chondroitin 4-sulfotransferase 11